jgi:hypothetical protein
LCQWDAEVRDRALGLVEDFGRGLPMPAYKEAYESLLVSHGGKVREGRGPGSAREVWRGVGGCCSCWPAWLGIIFPHLANPNTSVACPI